MLTTRIDYNTKPSTANVDGSMHSDEIRHHADHGLTRNEMISMGRLFLSSPDDHGGFSFDWYTKSRILGVKKTALSKVRSLKLSRNCFGSV